MGCTIYIELILSQTREPISLSALTISLQKSMDIYFLCQARSISIYVEIDKYILVVAELIQHIMMIQIN